MFPLRTNTAVCSWATFSVMSLEILPKPKIVLDYKVESNTIIYLIH